MAKFLTTRLPPARLSRLRFSLRSLILLIAVTGVILGIWQKWVARYLEIARVEAKWRGYGAWAQCDDNGKLRILVADMGPRAFDISALTELKGSASLEILMLTETDTRDSDLVHLTNLSRLRSLILNDTAITDVGMDVIAKHRTLTTLCVRNCNLTDACLPNLLQLTNLAELNIEGTQLSQGAIEELMKQMPHLRVMR